MKDFIHYWGDKLLLFFLILVFLGVAVYGYHQKEPDLASTTVDLAKQVVAALLTLLTVRHLSNSKPNGGNGNGTSSVVQDSSSTHSVNSGNL